MTTEPKPVDSIREAIARVERLLASETYSPLELHRALKDVEKIETRLQGHEYEKSNFDENTFCMQERSRMVLVEIDFYARVGKLWATILEGLDVRSASQVIDIGPGWFPKVEIGLVYAGFTGTLRVVDKSAEATKNLRSFLAVFDPQFTVESNPVDFLEKAVKPASIVTANHVVDDIIIDRYCHDHGLDPARVYEDEATFQRVWTSIVDARDETLETVTDSIAAAFERVVVPGGALAVSQYPSYMERNLQLPGIDRLCRDVLDGVGARLAKKGFEPASEIAERLKHHDADLFGADAFFVFRRSG